MRSWRLIIGLCLTPVLALAQPADKKAALDKLLDQLKAAPNETVAGVLEKAARQAMVDASTPAVTLLMSRGLRELNAGSHDDAIEDFTAAITLDATLAEAYHQRGVAKYQAGDTEGAIRDIQETLRREPRDFAALRTLTEIASAREDWKGAYAAWQKLLEIDPLTPNGEEKLKDLKRRAFGEET